MEQGVASAQDTALVISDDSGNPIHRVALINASSASADDPSAAATEFVITFDDIRTENIE
ncbi:hypothetical protein OG203_16350 [Nocardia sp. NBC_01499]|uniref:hypothetical protein n=1 Tax=Nocardia sp. NBC_01499 TaxID=2903597 RepID=UPI00386A1CC1